MYSLLLSIFSKKKEKEQKSVPNYVAQLWLKTDGWKKINEDATLVFSFFSATRL